MCVCVCVTRSSHSVSVPRRECECCLNALTVAVGTADSCSHAVYAQVVCSRVFGCHVNIPGRVIFTDSSPDGQNVTQLICRPAGRVAVLLCRTAAAASNAMSLDAITSARLLLLQGSTSRAQNCCREPQACTWHVLKLHSERLRLLLLYLVVRWGCDDSCATRVPLGVGGGVAIKVQQNLPGSGWAGVQGEGLLDRDCCVWHIRLQQVVCVDV